MKRNIYRWGIVIIFVGAAVGFFRAADAQRRPASQNTPLPVTAEFDLLNGTDDVGYHPTTCTYVGL